MAKAELEQLRLTSAMDPRRAYYDGRVLMGLHDFKAAESCFEVAMELDPRSPEYAYWAGLAAHEQMEPSGRDREGEAGA